MSDQLSHDLEAALRKALGPPYALTADGDIRAILPVVLAATKQAVTTERDEWARWLVVDTGAPWNWRPDKMPPLGVLRQMPAVMYQHDNIDGHGNVIHDDTTEDDYRLSLAYEWGLDLALLNNEEPT